MTSPETTVAHSPRSPTIWLQNALPRPAADHRLICFPHAGGSAALYRTWASALPGTDVHAVRYPGRAERLAEPCATDLRRTAADIAHVLRPLADRPLALFGHSMGAWIAFETARLLEAHGVRVDLLLASGARSPRTRNRPVDDGPLDDDAVAAVLTRLGGTDGALLADPELRRMVFPYVNADFRMLAGYVYRQGTPLTCPVVTIVGTSDPQVTDEEAAAWAAETTGPCRNLTLPGDHFYLTTRPPFTLLQKELGRISADVALP